MSLSIQFPVQFLSPLNIFFFSLNIYNYETNSTFSSTFSGVGDRLLRFLPPPRDPERSRDFLRSPERSRDFLRTSRERDLDRFFFFSPKNILDQEHFTVCYMLYVSKGCCGTLARLPS